MSITPRCPRCGEADYGTGHKCKAVRKPATSAGSRLIKAAENAREKAKGNPLVGVRLPVDLLAKLDADRGDMTRQDKIREILEGYFDG